MYLNSYKELIVWQRAITLVTEVYKTTNKLPKDETYNLTSQMRRFAVSIPSNIAEGYKRKSLGDFLHFLNIADGSLAELETQLIIAGSLYPQVAFKTSGSLLEEVQKMLTVMIKKLRTRR